MTLRTIDTKSTQPVTFQLCATFNPQGLGPKATYIFYHSIILGLWDHLPQGREDYLGEHETGAECLHKRRARLCQV